jgi:ATP-dependent Lon protease
MSPKNNTTITTIVKGKKGSSTQSKRRGKKDSDSESEYSESDYSSSSESESEYEDKRSKSKSKSKKDSKKDTKKVKDTKKNKKNKENKSDEEDEEEIFDGKGFKALLAQMFPSNFSKKKAKEAEEEEDKKRSSKKKKVVSSSSEEEDDDDDDDEDDSDYETIDDSSSSEEDSDEDSDEDSEDDDDSEEDSDEEESEEESTDKKKKKKNQKINIILSVGKGPTAEEEAEYNEYFGYEDDDDTDDDDEECDTDDEETFMKEKYEKIEQPPESVDSDSKEPDEKESSTKKDKKAKSKKADKKEEDALSVNVESEYIELLELKKDLSKKLEKNPKNKILKRAVAECSADIRKLVKDARKSNAKEYKKLIHNESNKPGEFEFFKTKMSNAEQRRIMSELKVVNEFMEVDKPYRLALLESAIPAKLKATAMQKINMLRSMDTCDAEYFKIKNWVDNFMRIPFCKYKSLSVSMADGIEKCHEFMANAKSILDKCVYGLDDAKLQILQMVGQWISNPNAMGTAIAIKGPPGTGKTTLVKDGISKILGREFVFIPLGGASDASYLEGHSYTYEGSIWGKIVQSLMDCQSMNPVFYFDELDKLSETPKGEEIAGILTHLTDTSQNSQFHDKYFSEMDFDLSKCLFIFSYNDESKVNPILRDRMYRIMTNGYDSKEKTVIARQYMLPKIREQVNFQPDDIIIPDETIKHIVSAKHLTQEEAGVRNMKRCLEIIHTKLNLFRLMKPEENLFSKDIKMEVKFPMTIGPKDVDALIKNEEKQSQSILAMYL